MFNVYNRYTDTAGNLHFTDCYEKHGIEHIIRADGGAWMSDIVDITKNLPHKVSEVICVNCGHRWIAVRPEDSKLRDLECPNCTKQGYAIETGEVLK